ncbi:hypothetical protein NQ318_000321 [Aromia moschata]|uniref:Ribosomal protein S12 n=1 Tax=Aromia moschata TaxID=1265417 RepID=A0AAV8XT26_9CUCU|nr:hypothetical protein NQ318_000321 [Aromia moschata]
MPIFLKISYFRPIANSHLRFNSQLTKSNLLSVLKTMPKQPKHIAEAQKQRIKIKERISKYAPGRVTLQVLGTGAKGAPVPCICSPINRDIFSIVGREHKG